jgi:hypothetical protein
MALVQVYRDFVLAVAISERYRVAIAGTNDGALVVVPFVRLSLVRAIAAKTARMHQGLHERGSAMAK